MSWFETFEKKISSVDKSDYIKYWALKRQLLFDTVPSELVSIDDHKKYIECVKEFRLDLVKADEFKGANYIEFLSNLLSVGADGLYTNDLRFLFELIQNVDDCDYEDPNSSYLNIKFDTNLGRIILEYNENGFTPFNVFAITGIAEAAKNVIQGKKEIGEKGIGFKSVFGVADKVLIQSGKFSFFLYKNNFTIPEPVYDNFDGINGTKLTLYLHADEIANNQTDEELAKERGKRCSALYYKILDDYSNQDNLFARNPVMFLNKLSRIKFMIDETTRYLEFDVTRPQSSKNVNDELSNDPKILANEETQCPNCLSSLLGELIIEDNVTVLAKIKDCNGGDKKEKKQEIKCIRYTKPILFDREMCVSRYGSKTDFNFKEWQLQIIVPIEEKIKEVKEGSLYSFLPTQIKTTVPVSCHIPFKLDSSREHIDNQGNNKWFVHCIDSFSDMLKDVYLDLSKRVGNGIISYLPKEYLFDSQADNDKIKCLQVPVLSKEPLIKLPIFQTVKGNYKTANEIYSFNLSSNELTEIDNIEELGDLLKYNKELFLPSTKVFLPRQYGIELYSDPLKRLFFKALENGEIAKKAISILDKSNKKYTQLLETLEEGKTQKISLYSLSAICGSSECYQALLDRSEKALKNYKPLPFEIINISDKNDIRWIISDDEPFNPDDELDTITARYLRNRKYEYTTADIGLRKFFIGSNILVLSNKPNPRDSFAAFCDDFGKNNVFSANLVMRSASDRLNKADDSISSMEYLKLLREVRNTIKRAFGKNQYEGYIKVIKECGTNSNRFLHELLQNADDCHYSTSEKPYFKAVINGNILKTEYNEDGFTKQNVRAITAIGDSTKKNINNDNFSAIGEKGIGFKSVFSVVNNVEIYSNAFAFKLNSDTPTIPEPIQSEFTNGTMMVFDLKKPENILSFSSYDLLSLCLCLRRLKVIQINGITINIEDVDNTRTITVGGDRFCFERYTFPCIIRSTLALQERRQADSGISEKQELIFYVPKLVNNKLKYYVYCGLPTAQEVGIPISVDAPFELNTSREDIIENNWNECIKQNMFEAFGSLLEILCIKRGMNVLDFLRFDNTNYGRNIRLALFKNNEWLNTSELQSILSTKHFIPTYDKTYYATPSDESICIYPSFAHVYFENHLDTIDQKKLILNAENDENKAKLNRIGVKNASATSIVSMIVDYSNAEIQNEKYRKELYAYLKDPKDILAQSEYLKKARFIPVKGQKSGSSEYVMWSNNRFYIDEAASLSPGEYWLLDTNQLSKEIVESVLQISINVLDDRYKQSMYDERVKELLLSDKSDFEKYEFLLNEYRVNKIQLTEARGLLLSYKYAIPLKTVDGCHVCEHVFVSACPEYYMGKILRHSLVSKEAFALASLIGGYDSLKYAVFENFEITNQLDAEDIEDFLDDSISYGKSILERCMFEGLISSELIDKYELTGLQRSDYSEIYSEDDFPGEPVSNYAALKKHVMSDAENARKIVKEQELRFVDTIVLPDGKKCSVDSNDIRQKTIKRYHPISNSDLCFCQMCKIAKPIQYIEVNNILTKPGYFWPQMRISLCLECSKKFIQLRTNKKFHEDFIASIKSADVNQDNPISIDIGNVKITFTQTHLAEIQEIIKSDKI